MKKGEYIITYAGDFNKNHPLRKLVVSIHGVDANEYRMVLIEPKNFGFSRYKMLKDSLENRLKMGNTYEQPDLS